MAMSNPTMDALSRGGSTANQGMSVANSMMQGVQRAMDSTSDLTFKLTNLLKTEEARKFNQGMEITKSLQNQFQFNVQQDFREEQLKSQERRWSADEALRGAKLQFSMDQAKITNPLVKAQIAAANMKNKKDKMMLDAYSRTLNGTPTGSAPAESTIAPPSLDNIASEGVSMDTPLNAPGSSSNVDYTGSNVPISLDSSTPSIEQPTTNDQYAMYGNYGNQIKNIDEQILNLTSGQNKEALFSKEGFITSGKYKATIDALKEQRKDLVSIWKADEKSKIVKPRTTKQLLDATYDKASSEAKVDDTVRTKLDTVGIASDKQDKLIEDAVAELKNRNIPSTNDNIIGQISQTLKNPSNLRKVLSNKSKVLYDAGKIIDPNTPSSERFTQSNKIISNIVSSPDYGVELNNMYKQMKPANRKRFDTTIYQSIIKGHTKNGNFNSHALMQNMPSDMFESIMGMTKGEYGALTSEVRDGVLMPNTKSTKEALAEDIMPTVSKLARDSDSQSQLGQWTRDSDDDKTAKALVGDFTQKLMEMYVKPSDIKTTMQLMDIKFQQDNEWFGGLGDNDIAENILQNETSLLNNPVYAQAQELVGEGNKSLVAAKPQNVKRFFISDDAMQGNAGRAHSGQIFARNIAAIMSSVGSDARLQNMLDKKNFIENHNTQEPFKIAVVDPTTNRDYVLSLNLNEIYGILSAFYGSITDVNK